MMCMRTRLRLTPSCAKPSPVERSTPRPTSADTCLGDDKGTWLSNNRITFTRFVSGDQYPEGYAAILYSATLDGSGLRRLSPPGPDSVYEDLYARFAPDRDYLVFSRARISDGAGPGSRGIDSALPAR